MMNKLDNIHDKFFKKVFSEKKNINTFLKIALPKPLQAHLNFNKLKIDSTGYVSNDIKEYFSDIVIKTEIIADEQKKHPSDIYILFEHKSYSDKKIFFQLLRYMYLMWEMDMKANKPLRAIIPLVFYHGSSTWQTAENFNDQFHVPKIMKQYMLNYQYILFDTNAVDLNHIDNQELRENVYLLTSLLLMKSAHNRDIESIIRVFDFWQEKGFIKDPLDKLFFFTYIVATKEVKEEKLMEIFSEKNIPGGEIMPTLAREWYDSGRKEGKQQGKENRDREIVLHMFRQQVSIADIERLTGIRQTEIKRIIANEKKN
jgi:predicted transposase/invertase (TIGR01784 family)